MEIRLRPIENNKNEMFIFNDKENQILISNFLNESLGIILVSNLCRGRQNTKNLFLKLLLLKMCLSKKWFQKIQNKYSIEVKSNSKHKIRKAQELIKSKYKIKTL